MLRRKDGTYQTQITIEVNGKKKQKYFYGKTQAEVKRKMVAYHGEVERGKLFKDVADEWWYEHKETLSLNTLYSYRPAYMRAVEEFGQTYIKAIAPKNINLFLVRFSKKFKSDKVSRTQLMILNLIFKYGIVNGYIDNNPAADVSVQKNLEKRKREMPSDEELDKVKSGIGCRFGLFAYLLLYTGCRRGEALALTHGDIDRENKSICINKSLYWDNNVPKIKSPKTEAGTRDIILLDKLAAVLPTEKATDLLFPDQDGGLYSGTRFQREWKFYMHESGVTITPHQLRHAFATMLFEADINEKDAQQLLGHANVSTTQDIYTHIRKQRERVVADKLNSVIL